MSLYRRTIEIPGLPNGLNGSHGHWRKSSGDRRKWRRIAFLVARSGKCPVKPLNAAGLILVRHSAVEMDFDNLVAAFKPIVDGLVDARIIADDTSRVIQKRSYRWEKAPISKGYLTVEVEELET